MYNSCPQNAIVLKATQGDMAYTCFSYSKFNFITDDPTSTKLGKNSKFVITATPHTGSLPYSNDVL